MTVYKRDGIGTRGNGASQVANLSEAVKTTRFYASEAVTKGDLLAFDFAATEPSSGYGNHVKICDTGDALNAHGIGVAVEAAALGDLVEVQYYGLCSFAKVDQSAVADGQLLGSGSDAGLLDLYDTSAAPGAGGDTIPVAICIVKAADDTAASKVWLLNPANI